MNVFTRILNYFYTQLRISYTLAKITRNIDLWIFYIGGDSLLLPMLTVKLLRKKVVLAFAGSSVQTLKSVNDSFFKPVKILSKINCILSKRIIVYSENLIKGLNLEKYRNKIYIAHKHFIDFERFKIKKKFNDRADLVGYIGRLSEEKGVLNFVKAIPQIIKERDDLVFLIGGDGPLRDKIERYLEDENLNDKVKLTGWVPHDNLPDYMNELKLVVLSSYTEGLPNVMLEAMACGTPVLATPVGAIPDVIKDGKNGFIMENNSAECIAENVIRVLNYSELDKIVKNASELVERDFTYAAAVERYRKILEGI
jgi:glycosyltransferase involved in cell wall biosynthesis